MFKRIALATLLLVSAPIAAANAQGFLVGMVVGGILFGGSNQYGGGGATILYSADQDKLTSINPMDVRMAVIRGCFDGASRLKNKKGKSLGEMLKEATAELPEKERVVLQIARVFSPQMTECAAIWFAYIEK